MMLQKSVSPPLRNKMNLLDNVQMGHLKSCCLVSKMFNEAQGVRQGINSFLFFFSESTQYELILPHLVFGLPDLMRFYQTLGEKASL